MAACGGRDPPRRAAAAGGRPGGRPAVRRGGTVPPPVQLPATTGLPDGRALALAGLDSQDVSSDTVTVVSAAGRARVAGHLPQPLHDAAAATIGGHAYLFGGGPLPTDQILSVAPGG